MVLFGWCINKLACFKHKHLSIVPDVNNNDKSDDACFKHIVLISNLENWFTS